MLATHRQWAGGLFGTKKVLHASLALLSIFASLTHAATCPGGSTAYNTVAVGTTDMSGPWRRYFLNWPYQNNPNVTPRQYSISSNLHFDSNSPFQKTGSTSDPVAGYNDPTVFGHAALEYQQDAWKLAFLAEFTFRFVAPCTADYQFQVKVDGISIHAHIMC